MRLLEYQIQQSEAGRTVKSIALKEMHLSRGQFSSLKFKHGLRLDGEIVHADQRLLPGQVLSAFLEDESSPGIIPYDLPLQIAYADEDYLIVDKPAPLPTLSSAHQQGPTLENALYSYLGQPENYIFRPVNRLDKGTSGLMAVARNAHAQQRSQKLLHTDHFIREYLAVCHGTPLDAQGVIDLPIGKTGDGARREIRSDGRRAVTHYWVEEKGKNHSLVRLRLETGRTHQIRVHLMALGCPIAGDYLYGTPHPALPGRFALHACKIRFIHPITGCEIALESPVPSAFRALLD